jgi:nicotinate-nucleotide adenylyltransferase
MSRPTPRIALFGGTFDPIHRGHLAVARSALDSGLVDEVRFVVAGNPPHKPAGPRHSAEERWCMAILATLDEPRYRVERWEIDRPGRSFAVDTVRQAQAALPGAELYWVIGADAMALIDTWHDVEALFGLTRFLVVSREGFDEAALRDRLAHTCPWAGPDAFRYMAMPPVNISSTALRAQLAAGEDVSNWLPPPVAAYIQRYALYRTQPEVAR